MNRYLLAAVLLCLSSAAIAQMYGDPAAYTRRGGATPVGNPPATLSCGGSNGNVLQPGYNGMYAAPGGYQIELLITGHELIAVVRRPDGTWLEGVANTGPSSTQLSVPLSSPNGSSGLLLLCASHLTADGFCSRLSAGVVVNGSVVSGLQGYTRNRAPIVPYCVR